MKAWITKQKAMSGMIEKIHLTQPDPEKYEVIIEGVWIPKELYEQLLGQSRPIPSNTNDGVEKL